MFVQYLQRNDRTAIVPVLKTVATVMNRVGVRVPFPLPKILIGCKICRRTDGRHKMDCPMPWKQLPAA
jgi:hypothetical protein